MSSQERMTIQSPIKLANTRFASVKNAKVPKRSRSSNNAAVWSNAIRLAGVRESVAGVGISRNSNSWCRYYSWLANRVVNHLPGLLNSVLVIELVYVVVDNNISVDDAQPDDDIDCDEKTLVDTRVVTAQCFRDIIPRASEAGKVIALGWFIEYSPEGVSARNDAQYQEYKQAPTVSRNGVTAPGYRSDETEQ